MIILYRECSTSIYVWTQQWLVYGLAKPCPFSEKWNRWLPNSSPQTMLKFIEPSWPYHHQTHIYSLLLNLRRTWGLFNLCYVAKIWEMMACLFPLPVKYSFSLNTDIEHVFAEKMGITPVCRMKRVFLWKKMLKIWLHLIHSEHKTDLTN